MLQYMFQYPPAHIAAHLQLTPRTINTPSQLGLQQKHDDTDTLPATQLKSTETMLQ